MDLTPVVAEVLKLGFAGAVIVVLFFALKARDAAFRESQDKRIAESQANTEKFLMALNASNDTGKATVKAIEGMQLLLQGMVATLTEIKNLVEGGGSGARRSK